MKKYTVKVAVVLIAAGMMCSSCIGSFGLFNKYEKWQCSMTGNKYVNGIVGLILQPIVAPICALVDVVVLNTIEFWTGKSPVTAQTIQQIKGQDGRLYAVKTTKKGYEIKSPTGEVTLLIFNEQEQSWTMSQNGQTREIFRVNPDGTIRATLQDVRQINVTADQAGLDQVRQAVDDRCFALR